MKITMDKYGAALMLAKFLENGRSGYSEKSNIYIEITDQEILVNKKEWLTQKGIAEKEEQLRQKKEEKRLKELDDKLNES